MDYMTWINLRKTVMPTKVIPDPSPRQRIMTLNLVRYTRYPNVVVELNSPSTAPKYGYPTDPSKKTQHTSAVGTYMPANARPLDHDPLKPRDMPMQDPTRNGPSPLWYTPKPLPYTRPYVKDHTPPSTTHLIASSSTPRVTIPRNNSIDYGMPPNALDPSAIGSVRRQSTSSVNSSEYWDKEKGVMTIKGREFQVSVPGQPRRHSKGHSSTSLTGTLGVSPKIEPLVNGDASVPLAARRRSGGPDPPTSRTTKNAGESKDMSPIMDIIDLTHTDPEDTPVSNPKKRKSESGTSKATRPSKTPRIDRNSTESSPNALRTSAPALATTS